MILGFTRAVGGRIAAKPPAMVLLISLILASGCWRSASNGAGDRDGGLDTDIGTSTDTESGTDTWSEPEHLWSKGFPGEGSCMGYSVAVDPSNNVFITGFFEDTIDFGGGKLTGAGGMDVFVAKFSPDGEHLWSEGFGGEGEDYGTSVTTDSAGNAIVTGAFCGTVDFGGGPLSAGGDDIESSDIFVVKLGPQGDHLWSRRYGDESSQSGMAIATDDLDNVLFAGDISGTVDFGGGEITSTGSGRDAFVAKLDPQGDHVWSLGFEDQAWARAVSIAADGANNVIVGGVFTGGVDLGDGMSASAGGRDGFVVALDEAGSVLWSRVLGGGGEQDYLRSLAAGEGGGVVVTGIFSGSVDFGGGPLTSEGITDDVYLAEYGADGEHDWSVARGNADWGAVWSWGVAINGVGEIVLVGWYTGPGVDLGGGALPESENWDMFVAKYGSGGDHHWSTMFGSIPHDLASAVTTDGEDNILITGYVEGPVDFGGGPLVVDDGPPIYERDVFLLKLSP